MKRALFLLLFTVWITLLLLSYQLSEIRAELHKLNDTPAEEKAYPLPRLQVPYRIPPALENRI